MDDHLKEILVEARAKVMWGHKDANIRVWLASEGLEFDQVNVVMQECMRQRAVEIRKAGLRDLLVGTPITVGWVIFLAMISEMEMVFMELIGLVSVLGLYGVYRVWRGANRMLDGARARGSLAKL